MELVAITPMSLAVRPVRPSFEQTPGNRQAGSSNVVRLLLLMLLGLGARANPILLRQSDNTIPISLCLE